MHQRILVFLSCVVFEILLLAAKSISILVANIPTVCCTLGKMIHVSFVPFEFKNNVHQKQQISGSLERDRKQSLCILNTVVVTVVCVAVIVNQISAFETSLHKSWKCCHQEVNIKDDLYMPWSKNGILPQLSFLREVRSIPIQKIWTLPFSLGEYMNKSENGNKEEFMNYEWGRYETFKDFPMDSPATPTRLAASGFYYMGTEDTVVCFSCKLKYSGWKEGDIPDALHKRFSPDCDFIKGIDSKNVPIHATSESISNDTGFPTNGAIGGTSYTTQSFRESCNSNMQLHHQSRQSELTNEAGSSRRINHKFPDYENIHHRTDSFDKWPCADVIDPAVLVEAGFFYAGFSDCVRCFSCGGGLRNWEYGDGPWEEHARWFQWCKFLREQKGLEFIRQYQETHTESDDELPTEAIVSGDEALRTLGGTLEGNRKHHETDNYTTEKEISENKNGGERNIACEVKEKLNEMGFKYSFHYICKAIRRLKCNGDQISTESVITHLLDNSENFENPEQADRDNSEVTTISEEEPVFVENIRSNNDTEKKNKHNAKPSRDASTDLSYALTAADPCTLQEENAKLKSQLLCKICMDSDSDVVFIPCGHMVSCEKCAPHIRKCAVCRVLIKGRVKAFMS